MRRGGRWGRRSSQMAVQVVWDGERRDARVARRGPQDRHGGRVHRLAEPRGPRARGRGAGPVGRDPADSRRGGRWPVGGAPRGTDHPARRRDPGAGRARGRAGVAVGGRRRAIGALAGQRASSRSQANVLSAGVLGAFLLRMVADSGSGLAWLRWATPLGWVEELHPLTGSDPFAPPAGPRPDRGGRRRRDEARRRA